MENVSGYDQWVQILNELLEGQESAKQLRFQLLEQTAASLGDDHQLTLKCSLIEKMLASFDKTIKIAKQISLEGTHHQHSSNPITHFQFESPRYLVIGSRRSKNSQPDLRPTKRRKTMPKWSKTVQVSQGKSVSGLEGALDDGFSWRKYGQKDILGAKFPRGYYRCTHRHSRCCTATKQVQRSDEDPSIYQVMYRGEHTCYTGPQLNQAQNKPPPSPAQTKIEELSPQSPQEAHHHTSPSLDNQEVFVGLGPDGDLKVELEEAQTKAQLFRCFSFATALPEPEPIDHFLSCSADFASSPTSESSYLPASPYQFTEPHLVLNVQTSESDTSDPISGPNSVNNSPTMVDFEFPLDQLLELDPNFF